MKSIHRRNDFAVVFLTRVNSLQPFMRHLPGDSLLEELTEHEDGWVNNFGTKQLQFQRDNRDKAIILIDNVIKFLKEQFPLEDKSTEENK